jgi:phosphatidylserine/phosphatidylglycerophosphate/cardiolipin synthase-like enzyme
MPPPDDAELVGGVLYAAPDPDASAEILAGMLKVPKTDIGSCRRAGFEPSLVDALRKRLPKDSDSLDLACLRGAAWILGRRSVAIDAAWEAVASLPRGLWPPAGLRRTTGETLIGLVAEARTSLRLAAPYVDDAGLGYLIDPLVAATLRGVEVEVIEPQDWPPARQAIRRLVDSVESDGDAARLKLAHAVGDAPFLHLKVLTIDSAAAYVGSANVTAAGLAGRNLELGVLVRGSSVQVIERILDLFRGLP